MKRLTKLQIIDETVEYYSADVSRRSIGEDGCMYKSPNGNMCAVGRCIEESKLQSIITTKSNGSGAYTLFNVYGTDILKEKYRGHEVSFWDDLQGFHDNPINWDNDGITEDGLRRASELKELYA
jgi:hypothetical protein